MKLQSVSQLKFRLALGLGVLVALVLCVQCVRTYWYTDSVLIPQQAELEAERQAGAVSAAARSAGATNPAALQPVIARTMESAADQVLWMRVLDLNSTVVAQGGRPYGIAKVPTRWWDRVEKHERLGSLVSTPEGKALVVALPLRMPRPAHPFEATAGQPNQQSHPGDVAPKAKAESLDPRNRPSGDHPGAYVLEMAIPLKAVAGAFEGLLHNLIVGQIASVTLLISVAVIGLCAPRYLRGRYLEGEMQLARQVQSNLQPKMDSISPFVEFAASSIAADQVGGDFYDIFKEESGKIAIILGDVSGKGLPAALLVSVLHGAIRSSTALQHEFACDRINRMLCERTAGERFVTMFWGVFDPETRILRYVNAGHAAPMLIRQGQLEMEILNEGGPVLGVLPHTSYSAGTVMIEDDDTLILYSDGISEASNDRDQEFGEARIHEIASDKSDHRAAQVCARIMSQVNAFASAGSLTDDRTLLVVKFSQSQSAILDLASLESGISAAA